MRRFQIALILCLLCCIGTVLAADAVVADSIGQLYDRLTDPDPVERGKARTELLGLKKDQLPLLKKAVASSQPVTPAQAQVLRDIVVHIHVHEAIGFGTKGDKPFLGVDTPEYYDFERPPAIGCLITQPFIGFTAYRYVQPGDIVVQASVRNMNRQVTTFEDFARVLKTAKLGDIVSMTVARGGSKVDISFPLESNPLILTSRNANAGANQANIVTATRLKPLIRDANRFFDKEFGPLLPVPKTMVNGFEPTEEQLKQSPRPGTGSIDKK